MINLSKKEFKKKNFKLLIILFKVNLNNNFTLINMISNGILHFYYIILQIFQIRKNKINLKINNQLIKLIISFLIPHLKDLRIRCIAMCNKMK